MAQNSIQIIPDPKGFKDEILQGVHEQILELRNEFQPKTPTEYLTRNELKDLLKVDLATIHRWTKNGKLKAYAIGNRVYYKRHEVEQQIIPLNFRQS